MASVGTDRGGNPIGLLTVTQTSSIDGSPTRQEIDAGRFQVNSDCTGGTLTFRTTNPSRNSIVPEAEGGETEAVKLTDWPGFEGFALEAMEVVLVDLFTFCGNAGEVTGL